MKLATLIWMTCLAGAMAIQPPLQQPSPLPPSPPRVTSRPARVFSPDTTPPPRPPGIAAGLFGSKHDFAPPGAPLADHCAACHGRPATQPAAQLWTPRAQRARAATSLQNQKSKIQNTPNLRTAASSANCLACHDGTIASDLIGGLDGDVLVPPAPSIDVTRGHPVGVPYPRADRGFRPASMVERSGIRLPDGRVECISCHDPHNTWGHPALLAASNRRSALCLSCHIK